MPDTIIMPESEGETDTRLTREALARFRVGDDSDQWTHELAARAMAHIERLERRLDVTAAILAGRAVDVLESDDEEERATVRGWALAMVYGMGRVTLDENDAPNHVVFTLGRDGDDLHVSFTRAGRESPQEKIERLEAEAARWEWRPGPPPEGYTGTVALIWDGEPHAAIWPDFYRSPASEPVKAWMPLPALETAP